VTRRIATAAAAAFTAAMMVLATTAAPAAQARSLASKEVCDDLRKMAQVGPIFKVEEGKLSAQDKADLAAARKMGDHSGSAAPNAMAQGLLKMTTGNGGKGAPDAAATLKMMGC